MVGASERKVVSVAARGEELQNQTYGAKGSEETGGGGFGVGGAELMLEFNVGVNKPLEPPNLP